MGLAALRGTDMNHCSQLDHLYHVTLWHNESLKHLEMWKEK